MFAEPAVGARVLAPVVAVLGVGCFVALSAHAGSMPLLTWALLGVVAGYSLSGST